MKNLSLNIKKIALSLMVVGLAVGFSAFTSVEKQTKLAPFYYGFNGVEYQLIGSDYDPNNCISGTERCVVESPDDTNPTISVSAAASLPSPTGNAQNKQYDF